DGRGAVPQAHDDAVAGACRDLQDVRDGLGDDGQGVVSGHAYGRGQPGEDAAAVVADGAGAAVDEFGGAGDGGAVGGGDGLVAETDAEQRQAVPGGVVDEGDAHAGVLGRAGAGADEDAVVAVGVADAYLVAGAHVAGGAQHAQVLDDGVHETVVVVHDEHAGHGRTGHGRTVTSSTVTAGSRSGNTTYQSTAPVAAASRAAHSRRRPVP